MTYELRKTPGTFDSLNLDMLNYYCNISDIVVEKTKPLEYIGVKHFSYLKIFPDNSFFHLGSNSELTKSNIIDFKNGVVFCQKHNLLQSDHTNFQYIKWPHTPSNQPSSSNLFKEKFNLFLTHNLWNGISFIRHENNTIKIYAFCGSKDEYNTSDHLYIIRKLLHKFIYFFDSLDLDPTESKNKGLGQYETLEVHYEKPAPISQEAIQKFLGEIKTKGFNISMGRNKINLSPREIECLKSLSQSKSHKEIGCELNISSKTVENHISNIKLKTDLHNKTALVNLYLKHFSHYF